MSLNALHITDSTSTDPNLSTAAFHFQVKSPDWSTHQVPLKINDTACEDINNNNDGPLAKKRKLTDPASQPRSASRPLSPPWRKIAVEGPTSFVEGGRRKSSRTNLIPLELQPQADKRQTRAANHKNQPGKVKLSGASTHVPSPLTPSSSHSQINGKRPHSSEITTANLGIKIPAKGVDQRTIPAKHTTANNTPVKRSHKKKVPPRSITPVPKSASPHQTRRSVRASQAAEEVEGDQESDSNGTGESEAEEVTIVGSNYKPQRLNLKVRMPTVTIQHPGHVLPQRHFSSFRDWLEHDDPLGGDDSGHLSYEEASRQAKVRRRLAEAARPGGVLSEGRCSVIITEPQEEPSRQYAHQDHLIAHAVYFHKLMKQEQRHHLSSARRIVYAAAAEWKRRQPKTEDEVELDPREVAKAHYKQLRKDLLQKWEMINVEVERRRLQRWKEEQDVLGKQALNRVLEQSTQLLHNRRQRDLSETGSAGADQENSDDEEDHTSEGSSSGEQSQDESNMSSNQSESEEDLPANISDDDAGLTVEELRRKYAELPSENQEGRLHRDDERHEDVVVDDPESGNEMDLITFGTDVIRRSGVVETEARRRVRDTTTEDNGAENTDEVTDVLMDESDASTDMDDDMGDSDDESEASPDFGEESEASEEDRGLLGFFARKEYLNGENIVDASGPPDTSVITEISEGEADEVSLIPDATQVQTPSASNSEEPFLDLNGRIALKSGNASGEVEEVSRNVQTGKAAIEPSPLAKLISSGTSLHNHRDSLPSTPISSHPLKTPVPPLLRGTLREYQHYGLDWLAGIYANGTNGILADEMGLGKTIQTIALLAHLAVEHEVWGPHLIVVPTSVMLNWEMEFKKFLPGFKILTYYGSQEERKQKRKGWLDDDKWHVCITSYQLVLQDQQTFKRRAWHYMVLDEAHNIKNFRSQRWQTLLTFRTRARLLLTGTPLQNNLTELWSLLFFLMPSDSTDTGVGGFADLQEFSQWFRKPVEQILEHGRETMDEEAKAIISKLHKVLRPYLLRRLKADVEKQMPGKYEHVVYCRLSKRQRYLYDGFMSRAQTRETLASGNYLSIINCLMQLRKVCNHPDLFETRQIVTSFAMPRSAIAEFEIKELLVRRRLLQDNPMNHVDLEVVNLLPGANGPTSALHTLQNQRLGALHTLRQLSTQQYSRVKWNMPHESTSIGGAIAKLENDARSSRLEGLRHCAYLTSLRSQRRPLYSYTLVDRLTIDLKPSAKSPKRRAELAECFSSMSDAMRDMMPTLSQRSELLETTIQKFACVTPSVVATDMAPLALSRKGVEVVRSAQKLCPADAFHEARMRLSIAFPDKRLLQYDCGKLQRLDTLLRTLQTGGHRALIFTQMTKVLDILEQFLNIHGHRYLRLDGSTKIEQRQILTDRFNSDNRILAFILSTRSGGLGINLTGADTVIFYDLDWNPAMDKQCQDRCHRIGQTRDVHIYRFISEYTIEANILRKANQKRMLDDVIIQEGEFTTEYFNKSSVGDTDTLNDEAFDGDAEANAAMDRVLGGGAGNKVGKVFEQVEDKEDIAAAKLAEKELAHTDDYDFEEKAILGSSGEATPKTPRPLTPREQMPPPSASIHTPSHLHAETVEKTITMEVVESGLATPGGMAGQEGPIEEEEDEEGGHVDEYIIRFLEWQLKDVPVAPPPDTSKKRSKKARDHRPRRPR
ncbi:swr1 complex component [Toensbergia leucococca]|nr:swr1 complex component [Toensbergia leucococca]